MNGRQMDHVVVRDDGFHKDDLAGEDFLTVEELLGGVEEPVCLKIGNDQEPEVLIPSFCWISTISIPFPDFADGRGFSLAMHLRQLGYEGRLRATGHLISDQYRMARQSGFNEIAISQLLAARQPEHHWTAQSAATYRSYQLRLLDTG